MIQSVSGENFEVVSFVSDKNTNVDTVQFVMVTKEIKKPEVVNVEPVKKKKTFIERLKDLF